VAAVFFVTCCMETRVCGCGGMWASPFFVALRSQDISQILTKQPTVGQELKGAFFGYRDEYLKRRFEIRFQSNRHQHIR
jgi:hypothetical protein